jgi:hypothetical protein
MVTWKYVISNAIETEEYLQSTANEQVAHRQIGSIAQTTPGLEQVNSRVKDRQPYRLIGPGYLNQHRTIIGPTPCLRDVASYGIRRVREA